MTKNLQLENLNDFFEVENLTAQKGTEMSAYTKAFLTAPNAREEFDALLEVVASFGLPIERAIECVFIAGLMHGAEFREKYPVQITESEADRLEHSHDDVY
jgi:hypothetical protein